MLKKTLKVIFNYEFLYILIQHNVFSVPWYNKYCYVGLMIPEKCFGLWLT